MKWQTKFSTLVLLLLLLNTTKTLASNPSCEEILTFGAFHQFQRILARNFRDYPSSFSMEFDRASSLTIEPQNRGKNVISFGSGPDIFTPILNFPLAENIHLVDLWTGWGAGSGEVINEAIRRVFMIHSEVHVSLVSMGFLQWMPTSFRDSVFETIVSQGKSQVSETIMRQSLFQDDNPNLKNIYDSGSDFPIVLSVRWDQGEVGRIERKIFIHVSDFNDPDSIRSLNAIVERNGKSIAGIVATGTEFPMTLQSFLDRLALKGSAILETFSDHSNQIDMIDRLEKNDQFSVELSHLNTYIRNGSTDPIKDRLYVVKKHKY